MEVSIPGWEPKGGSNAHLIKASPLNMEGAKAFRSEAVGLMFRESSGIRFGEEK